MNYQDLQSEENEILSVEDEKVRQMCGGLKRVNAPKNFDFRLKARIAAFKPQTAKSPVFAFLRYAAPLGLVVAIFGAIVSNNLFSVDNTAVPQLAESFTETPRLENSAPIEDETPIELASRENGPTANFGTFTANENSNSKQILTFPANVRNEVGKFVKNLNNKNRAVENDGGGSRDSASTQSRIRVPQSFNVNKSVETPNNFTNPTAFSVKDILSTIGIEASFAGNGWKVQSVRQDSKAELSGVKTNDIIEALDDTKLSTDTIRTNSINVKKITFIRNGTKFEIVLK